jgi:signal transduction histidine kinase
MQEEKATKRKRGLSFKIIFFICSSLTVIFTVIFLFNHRVTKNIVEKNLKSDARNITSNVVLKIDKVLSTIQKIPDNFSVIVDSSDLSDTKLKGLLRMMVENNPDIYGAAIAFEPYFKDPKQLYYSFYYHRDSTGIQFSTLGNEKYDYFTMDWYQVPKELGRSAWSEPYFDEGGGNIIMTTYSCPLFRKINGEKKFIGILTADVSIDRLQKYVDEIKVYKTGYGYMISQNGTIVTHPVKDLIMNESIFSLADEQKVPQLREIGRKMIRGQTDFVQIDYRNVRTGKLSWISYAPVPLNGWSVAVIFPVDEFMADVNRLDRIVIFLVIAGLAIIFIVVYLISKSITRPLRRLTSASEEFASGNFDVILPDIRSKDEIGSLNASFITMQKTLAATISDLKSTTEQLKISNEKLDEYNRTLEQKVEQRTADLKAAQVQLIQSEKMASLGQLTAGIAHEIKNPLNFVNNFAELSIGLSRELTEEIDKLASRIEPTEAEYLKEIISDLESNVTRINDHGKRADSIVRGMLLHSRGKSGEKQLTDINAVLSEYVNLGYHGMRATDNTFNIKIENEYDPAIGKINVVTQDLSRVFLNLINNACYSTAQKKKELKDAYFPVLSVRTTNLGDRVEIKIKDNGKGIPKEITDKIFNPFFTTKPAGSGTGLGLSMSYDIIVNEHKGEIKVDSREGEFAEFTIVLPKDLN